MEDSAVTLFREYLRIPTVQPDVDYSECVNFLKRVAKEIGLPCCVYEKVTKPVVIITWEGTARNVGAIMLNSHTDVVPVYKEKWIHDPFGAYKDEAGNIYARGAQDDKCIGIQYLEAIRRLIKEGVKPKRTVHISFVPDEEICSVEGMRKFVTTEDFKKLNIEFAMDEGVGWTDDVFIVFNDERCNSKVKINCKGPTGHGSLFHHNTAGEQFHKVLDAFMDFRQSQVKKLAECEHPIYNLGDVTAVNLTKVEGGIQNNVVPPLMSLMFDVRLSVNTDQEEFVNWVKEVCTNAGDSVTYEILECLPKAPKTVTDNSNPFWKVFKEEMDKMGLNVVVMTNPASADARFLRRVGIPTLGFSPMPKTPLLVHDHNEYLNEKTFLAGIDIYKNIIKSLVNV